MKRSGLWAGGVFVLCVLAALLGWHLARRPRAAFPLLPRPAVVSPGALRGITVVLDPGHGGEDPGAVRSYGTEAAYTYRAALEIGHCLRAQGAHVVYTVKSRALSPGLFLTEPPVQSPTDASLFVDSEPIRTRHTPRQLWLRAASARRVWDARTGPNPACRYFFLSLHMDDSPDPNISGSLVCIDRRRPPPAFGFALARALARDGLARRDSADSGQPGLSVRKLGVLNPAYNPIPQSVLLEMTTLSNFDDSLRVSDPAWRLQMAARIAASLAAVRAANSP